MKKSMVFAAGLVLLSTSAYATKSRLAALGENASRGSHYIDDNRNVFRNAAHAGSMTNYVVTEWESGTAASGWNGGFFKEAGSFNYGVYLNDQSDSQNAVASAAALSNYGGQNIGDSNFLDRSDNLDLFFAGDMGFQWGARIGYTNSSNKSATTGAQEQSHSGMSLGAGVIFGDIEGSINFVLKDEYENASNTSTTATGKADNSLMNLSLAYHWGSWTFFGEFETKEVEVTSVAGTTPGTDEQTEITVGAGHTHEVSSTARIYSDVQYNSTSGETKAVGATTKSEKGDSSLSVGLAFEADANSWLTWRGAVRQSVLIDKATTKAATAGALETEIDDSSTEVDAGLTLNFGKLKVDGQIGASTGSGVFNTDTLLTTVGVHYWF